MVKRLVDVVIGGILAALSVPFVVAGAIGCAISLRAWPFFVQERVGKDGRRFNLPKLRTLPPSAPPSVDKYALHRLRIPAFCRILRRTHLDELPQLFVVPLGWMSLVGPRPEMPDLLERYPEDFAAARSAVRPGCTGLWQISAASGKLIYESPEYDLLYAQLWRLRLDAWILYRTLRTLATGRAPIQLDDIPSWALKVPRCVATELASAARRREPVPTDATAVELPGLPGDAVVICLRSESLDEPVVVDLGRDREPATILDLVDSDRRSSAVIEPAGHGFEAPGLERRA